MNFVFDSGGIGGYCASKFKSEIKHFSRWETTGADTGEVLGVIWDPPPYCILLGRSPKSKIHRKGETHCTCVSSDVLVHNI